MRVQMTRPRRFQNAGTEEQLDAGAIYDLPAVVAQALIATDAAVRVEEVPPPDDVAAARRDLTPPEGRPLTPPERKHGSR